MIVTISEFRMLASDRNGNLMPLGKRTRVQALSGAGAFQSLGQQTQFVRFATDTSVLLAMAGGGHDSVGELFVANSVEYIAVDGSEVLTISVA